MACVETYVTLRIFSDTMHPDEITSILGIAPTVAKPRDPNSKYRPRRETNFWGWDTRPCDSTENLDHVRKVVELLDGKQERLDKLRALGCELDLISYWVGNGQGGPFLDIPTMRSLCDLGLEIGWDTYFQRDEDVPDINNGAKDGVPESPLHDAAWRGDTEEIRRLVQAGAEVDWRDSLGETALFGAAAWGNVDAVKALLELGAQPNLQEAAGYTPLHWAASHGNIETIKALLAAGADPVIADVHGQKPADVAHKSGKGDHVVLLRSWPAKRSINK